MLARSNRVELHALASGDLHWALDYWRKAADGRWAPRWGDLDLAVFPSGLLPRLCVVDTVAEPLNFRYRYWGTAVTGIHHFDLTGRTVRDLRPPGYADCIWDQYRQVHDVREPLAFITEIPLDDGRSTYFAALRLPLAGTADDVGHVLTAEDFGQHRDELRELFLKLRARHQPEIMPPL